MAHSCSGHAHAAGVLVGNSNSGDCCRLCVGQLLRKSSHTRTPARRRCREGQSRTLGGGCCWGHVWLMGPFRTSWLLCLNKGCCQAIPTSGMGLLRNPYSRCCCMVIKSFSNVTMSTSGAAAGLGGTCCEVLVLGHVPCLSKSSFSIVSQASSPLTTWSLTFWDLRTILLLTGCTNLQLAITLLTPNMV